MDRLRRTGLSLLLLAAAAAGARAEEVLAVNYGDTVSGSARAGVLEAVPFDAVDGTLLAVDLLMAPGSGARFDILQPDRTLLPGLAAHLSLDSKGSRARAKKVPLLQSGRHFLLVRPTVAGDYVLKLKGRAPKKGTFEGFIGGTPPTPFEFGAVAGTLVTVKLAATKASGLAPKVVFLRAPSGAAVDLETAASHRESTKADLYKSLPLPELGTYTLGLGTRTGLFGDYGILKVSLKYPKVKKAKRDTADVLLQPFVDSVLPAEGFDNLAYTDVVLGGEFFAPGTAVRLAGPGGSIPATSVTRYNDQILGFSVDLAGRATGAYDVVVTHPRGGEGVLPGGFLVEPTPLPSGVTPSTGFDNRTQDFTLLGARFQAGMSVEVRPSAGGASVGAVVGAVTDTTAALSVPLLDAALGDHDLIVTNPDGGARTLAAALTVIPGPRIQTVVPLLGHDNDAARLLALTGAVFQPGMEVRLERAGQPSAAGAVANLAPTSAEATFDLRGRASGNWTLRVTNPDGGTLPFGAPFVLSRAPRVTALSLARGFAGDTASGVFATGTDFVAGAQASLEAGGLAVRDGVNEVVTLGGTRLTFDIDLGGVPSGRADLRVTNPDGGSELLVGPLDVLGRRTLASSVASAGRPSIAYNALDDEYLAVYPVTVSGQSDVRARRFSALTGEPLGAEIAITAPSDDDTASESQADPCVVFSGSLDLYLVVYSWSDPSSSGDRTRIRGQFVNRDGSLHTPQANAFTLFTRASGGASPPRVAWNATRQEWLAVWAYDTAAGGDVHGAVLDKGILIGGTRVPSVTWSGVLVANSHTVSGPQGTATIQDQELDADVAWSATSNEYLVAYEYDFVESGNPLPADTGTDVRARIFDGSFASGPVQRADLTNLGNVSGVSEKRPRAAWGSAPNRYLVGWDYQGSAGNRDVRVWLVDAVTRARVGTVPTTVEGNAADDAAFPALAFDATSGNPSWLVAFAINPGVSSTSRLTLTRIPPLASSSTGLGSASHRPLVPAASGAGYSLPAIGARGTDGEYLGGWAGTGAGVDPAEARFWR